MIMSACCDVGKPLLSMVVSIFDASMIFPPSRNNRTALSNNRSEAGDDVCCACFNNSAMGDVFLMGCEGLAIRIDGSPQPISNDSVKKEIKRATRFNISVQSTRQYPEFMLEHYWLALVNTQRLMPFG